MAGKPEIKPKDYCAYMEIRLYSDVTQQVNDRFSDNMRIYACDLTNKRCVAACADSLVGDVGIDTKLLSRCPSRRTLDEIAVKKR